MTLSRMTVGILQSGLILALCAPLVGSKLPTTLETIRAKGKIEILSRNGPTTFYEGPHGLSGFEYSLAKAFADDLGVELEIRNEDNLGLLIDSVGTERGALGASGLTITEKRQRKVKFGTPYLEITQQLLYRSTAKKPESIDDLIGSNLVVIANSAHAERLRELQKEHPELRWKERNDLEMIDLVEMIHSGTIDYTIVDSNAFSVNKNIYPRAKVAFDISDSQQLAWIFPKRSDSSLYDAAQEFFEQVEADGRLAAMRKKYYEQEETVNRSGALLFTSRIENRLPRWKTFLEDAGKNNELDWRLLAAISYQESHWNARARSHTGVRGLMMLTQATAQDMGITNRIDPEQSISGGAKYFRSIYDRIPEGVQGRDRTWMALAAYNVGFGHLEDARVLTQTGGKNPNKWDDVKEYLPLLAKRKYYTTAKHGYARGWEPVEYVQNIRHFYNVLAWHDQMETRRLATLERGNDDFQPVNNTSDAAAHLSLAL